MTVKRYRVAGRVQGVGFRAFVARCAMELGVDGWVRNMSDGTVEALVEASEAAHAGFEDRLREGPRFSKVEFVLVVEEPDGPAVDGGFVIARDGV